MRRLLLAAVQSLDQNAGPLCIRIAHTFDILHSFVIVVQGKLDDTVLMVTTTIAAELTAMA